MSSIDKRPNGRWRARYRDKAGRSHSKTFDRRADAQSSLDDVGHDMRRGQWIDPKLARIPFEQWADRWWTTTTKLRPTTRRGYWGHPPAPRASLLRGMAAVRHQLHRRRGVHHPPPRAGSVAEVHQGLRLRPVAVLKSAVRADVRKDNPAADHNIPIPRRKLHEGDVLSMEQSTSWSLT